MGSKTALLSMRFIPFALNTSRLPACNQSPLKHDWSIPLVISQYYEPQP